MHVFRKEKKDIKERNMEGLEGRKRAGEKTKIEQFQCRPFTTMDGEQLPRRLIINIVLIFLRQVKVFLRIIEIHMN